MTICECCKRSKEGYCIYCPENDKNGNKKQTNNYTENQKHNKFKG